MLNGFPMRQRASGLLSNSATRDAKRFRGIEAGIFYAIDIYSQVNYFGFEEEAEEEEEKEEEKEEGGKVGGGRRSGE